MRISWICSGHSQAPVLCSPRLESPPPHREILRDCTASKEFWHLSSSSLLSGILGNFISKQNSQNLTLFFFISDFTSHSLLEFSYSHFYSLLTSPALGVNWNINMEIRSLFLSQNSGSLLDSPWLTYSHKILSPIRNKSVGIKKK